MSSMRDIKQRIANVSSAKQIIKAMDMVASTKLYKARAQLDGIRPIYNELKRTVEELNSQEGVKTHEFYEKRKIKNSLYIIMTSNRGLSGSYNANIIAKALEHMDQKENVKIIVVGSKGNEALLKKKKNIIHAVTDVADAYVYYGSEQLAQRVTDYYLSGKVDEVHIAYTHFESILSYVPYVEKLLPVDSGAIEGADDSDKRYEPTIKRFIDHLIPMYLHMSIFRAYSEAHTSEQAARMVNMDAAGKNASDIIEDLTRMYNRKRQTAITQELSEIVGSANILNKGGIHDK